MSKGHIFLAQNSDIDYVRQAYALALSIKKFNKIHNQTCIITNNKIPEQYAHAFDHVVSIPWSDAAANSQWKVENRWKIIHATPFEENLVYDTDMLLLNSNDHWWKYFENKELFFTSNVRDFRGKFISDDYYRKTFTENNLTNIYTGSFYFKKVRFSYEFFKWLSIIIKDWDLFYKEFLKKSPQKFCSVDVSAALAIKFMDCEESVITSDTYIPGFIHMKPAIQGWKPIPDLWTNVINSYFDNDCRLKIGNIQQQGLFHYVENEFLEDHIIEKLENHE